MKRRKFIAIAGGTILAAGGVGYLLSDKGNFSRTDIKIYPINKSVLTTDEMGILYLASLAPSGHNTQPWSVKYIEPYHRIICSDKSKWLPAVDPTQRETILSIGAFTQNLEYAASNAGYNCQFTVLATTNQEKELVEVKLNRSGPTPAFNIEKIKNRRTVRSNYLPDLLKTDDLAYLIREEQVFFHFIPIGAKEYQYLNDQTIEANKIQSYRDAAEKELSEWIRFSSNDAKKYCDGLTTASMEIEGMPGWIVRNFYRKNSVMKKSFRDKNIDNVTKQVSQSAGWLLITNKGNEVVTLLETGKRMQKLFLKVRDKVIAIHPMTQKLEEPATNQNINQSIGISDSIQFILRIGYLKNYPDPVSVRRPVDWFVRSQNL
ncbi:MAG: nitroreductase [Bacteroidota bacterium]|nr:nitroreductase [Bacteroidota bacterium]